METFSTHSELALDDAVDALGTAEFAFGDGHRSALTVLDSFDGRLHAAGLRLELHDGRHRELVLRGPAGSPPVHITWTGKAPASAEDLPGGPFGARIAAVIGERALMPVFDVASVRREAVRRDRRGKPIVTVAVHDDVTVQSTTTGQPLRVIEVSTSLGSEPAVRHAVEPLVALGLTPARGDLVDAVLAITGASLDGYHRDPSAPLRRDDDAFDAFRIVLRNLLASAVDNLPGTLDDLDPEFLHDFRVALRRTRSVLGEGKSVLPHDVRDRFRTGFAELSAATSAARDLDVYVLAWPDTIAALGLDDPTVVDPLHDELLARRSQARAQLAKVLRSRAVKTLLESWRSWLDDDEVRPPYDAPRPIGPHVAARIAKAQSGLLRDGRSITADCPAERLHDLRKDAKRLRYLFECFGAVLPGKARREFVGQLKGLQDNLGLHQDAEVQTAELRALAHDLHARSAIGPDALLAVGRIIDHLERTRRGERDAFAKHFAAYDTADNRELLAGLLAKAANA